MGPTDEDRPAALDPPAQARLSQLHKGAIFSSGIEDAPVLSLSPLQTDPRSASASFEVVVRAMRQRAQIHRYRASSLSVRLRFKAITCSFPLLPWVAARPRPAGLRPRILLCSLVPPCCALLACHSVLFSHAVVTADATLLSGVEDLRLSRRLAGLRPAGRPSVRREVLACSTDWRHRRQRLSGRSVSTLIEQTE